MLISDIFFAKYKSSQRCFLEKDIFPACFQTSSDDFHWLCTSPPLHPVDRFEQPTLVGTLVGHGTRWGNPTPGTRATRTRNSCRLKGSRMRVLFSVGRCFCKGGKVGQIQKSWFHQVLYYLLSWSVLSYIWYNDTFYYHVLIYTLKTEKWTNAWQSQCLVTCLWLEAFFKDLLSVGTVEMLCLVV